MCGGAIQESARLLEEQRAYLQAKGSVGATRISRGALPAAEARAQVLQAVGRCGVVVINGETGCGKSTQVAALSRPWWGGSPGQVATCPARGGLQQVATLSRLEREAPWAGGYTHHRAGELHGQVPQFLLEEATAEGRGGECSIVVTQPRRISAISLATRVAQERGEALGQVVGYSVRLESSQSKRTRLLFCTTGILLRRLLSDITLQSVSHVVLDEVHERSVESDFLLLLLRSVLVQRPALKVVLMSATAEAGLFAEYFSQHPQGSTSLTIPGFTHPVREYFLEEVLERTRYVIGKASRFARKKKPSSSTTSAAPSDPHEEGDAEMTAAPESAPSVERKAIVEPGEAKAAGAVDEVAVPDEWDIESSDDEERAVGGQADTAARLTKSTDDGAATTASDGKGMAGSGCS
ncbi:hypothetical protein CYMTET_34249, partial [Cymbomonas tetramitiformis]